MAVSYKKLWKLLIDKNMNKGDLCKIADISSSSVTKMGKDGYVSTEIIDKICLSLGCNVEDVMEITHE